MTSVTTLEDEPKELNNRQREFARYYVEGIYSNAECARKAGYSPASSMTMASKLLNGSYDNIIVTRGPKGADYQGKNYSGFEVGVFDVCGAGDTFLSTLVYFYLRCGKFFSYKFDFLHVLCLLLI